MKKFLFLNILALILGAVQLNGQCSGFTVITQSTMETCVGANDGTATATAAAGSQPYFYSWSNGATTPEATGLSAGSYTVTATDVNGCVAVSIIQVELSPEGIWLMPSSTPVSCFGGNDGTGYPGVMSGTAPYTFTWDDPNNQTTETAIGLLAGSYHVTVTDVNGCSNVAPITVDSPSQLINSISNTTNETCAGNANGSVSASASGGTGSISYTWSNGGSGNTINGLTAGTYTVTATDANGCTAITSSTVGVTNPVVSAGTSSTNVVCNGANDGTAIVNVTSGTAPYTYAWSNGQTGATATGLSPGTYDVTITDANGCTWSSSATSNSVTITQPSSISINNTTSTNVTCNGANDGTIAITASGGTGTLSYSWSNGATGSSVNNLGAGTYTGTVTDGNGCTTTTSVTITEPSALSATGSTTDVTTPGGSDGTASVTATGGTPGYTYAWSNGATTQNISGLSGGTYTVTITDANGCTTTTTVTVDSPPILPITLTITNTSANCSNGSDGTATVSASGGVTPYTYSWSNGQTGATATGLAPGTYTATVTDALGSTETISTTVGSIGSNIVATASSSNETCAGSQDGHVSVSTSGGVGQMTFLWSNGTTTSTVNGLSIGTYTVTVTDENGCTATASTIIELSPEGVWVDVTPTDVSCFGANDGSASANATTGTAPYIYNWSNGQTSSNATGLAPGTYTVTVTDANGCANTYTTTINGPSSGMTITSTPTNIDCAGNNNGAVSISVTGGNPNYTYSWSNGSTSSDLSGLGAGTYTLTVTDSNGCTSTEVVTITEPSPVTASGTGTNPTTQGGSDGSIDLTVGGGTPGYTYLWSNGATTQNISGLTADCYTVTVTDSNGCTTTSTTCITDPLSGPNVTTTTISTSGCVANSTTGSVTANATSGTSPYTYLWSNGGTTQTISGVGVGTYTVTVTDANGTTATSTGVVTTASEPMVTGTGSTITCGNPNGTASSNPSGGIPGYTYSWSNGATTQDISGLAAGTYTVTVSDTNGCTATTEVVVDENIPPVIVMTSGTDPNTPGGMNGFVTANVTNGTQPYTYAWSNGGTTQTITGLSEGCYTVTVTDANNCTASSTSCIMAPTPLIVNTTSTQSNECSGSSTGTATAVVTSGEPPYTYLWSNAGTTETITGLPPGSYTVTVTDSAGSTASSTVVVGSVPMPTVVGTGSSINCGIIDGTATATPGGGTPGYTYEWSTGGTTAMIGGLGADIYTVTVTDSNGCTATTSVNVIENSPAVTVTASGTDPSTPGGMNGFVTASVSGGSPGFTYLWSNGGTTQTINNLGTGCYTVTVTDSNSCTATATTCITAPQPIMVTVTTTSSIECNGDNDGTATATPGSGTAPYTYIWSNGETTQTINNLVPNDYTVTVTDANGAMAVETVTVGSVSNPSVTGTGSAINCGIGDGTISATGSGGTPFTTGDGYTYLWNTGATTSSVSGLGANTYTVTVTDANGCTATTQVMVTENSPAVTATATPTNSSAPGANDGTITANPAGGTPGFTYLWSTGETTQTINNLSPACYTVTITDAVGCTASATECVTEPSAITVSVMTTPSIECNGDDDGTVTATPTSGTAPYTYIWSTGDMTATVNNLIPGDYTVTVTDANGAMAVETVTVGSVSNPSVTGTGSAINCGIGDGTISATGSGGTPLSTGDGYAYLWNTGATTSSVSGLGANTYTVTVTDANGCTATTQVAVTENSPAVTATATPTNSSAPGANDGTITANPAGGTPGFTYLWSTGETTQTINNLSPACYTVTITDAIGCTASATECVTEPVALTAESTSTPDSCSASDDGTATVTVLTGSPNYIYEWTPDVSSGPTATNLPAGTYTVLITDDNGLTLTETIVVGEVAGPDVTVTSTDISCNGMGDGTLTAEGMNGTGSYDYIWDTPNSDITNIVTGQDEGMYSVTVTDENGCTAVGTTTISQDDPIDALQSIVPIECNGGTGAAITVIPSGGSAPYSYQWSTDPTDTLATIDELPAGVYTVTITDANDCTAEQPYSIEEPEPISVNISGDTVSCIGSSTSAMLIAEIGMMVDSIVWTDANGTIIGSGASYEILGTSANQGDNMVFATAYAANGCIGEDSFVVVVPELIELETMPQDTVECEEISLSLSASSPTAISYTWYNDNGDELGTGANLDPFASTDPQYYYVVAEDAFGCTALDSVLAGHTEILSLLGPQTQICIGDSLTITASTEDLVGEISYMWMDPNGMMVGMDSTLNIANPVAGEYTVEISNQYGCAEMFSTQVDLFDLQPLLSATADEDTILKGMESQLLALPSEDGYTYLWSNPSTISQGSETDPDPMVMPEEDTNYQVEVTHPNGCSALTNVLVTVLDPTCDEPFIFFPNAFSPNDDGVNDVLYLRGFNVDEVYFMIFNRWGQKVFESNSQSEGWNGVFNGEKVCNDVYGFYLRVKCTNGEEYIKKGNVTVFN